MDSLDPLIPLQPPMFALGYACICGGNTTGDSSNAKQFNGLHNETKVSRGARSCRRANVEKRVVSIKHSLLFRMMTKQRWKLAGSVVMCVPLGRPT